MLESAVGDVIFSRMELERTLLKLGIPPCQHGFTQAFSIVAPEVIERFFSFGRALGNSGPCVILSTFFFFSRLTLLYKISFILRHIFAYHKGTLLELHVRSVHGLTLRVRLLKCRASGLV
jgi:hypothetical protein